MVFIIRTSIHTHPVLCAVKYIRTNIAKANSSWLEGNDYTSLSNMELYIFPCCVQQRLVFVWNVFSNCLLPIPSEFDFWAFWPAFPSSASQSRCIFQNALAERNEPTCCLTARHASQMVFSSQEVCCRMACAHCRRSSPGTAGGLW